jgi:Holliday junction resolvase RusA-like endonuclease
MRITPQELAEMQVRLARAKGKKRHVPPAPAAATGQPEAKAHVLRLLIPGQVRGGKNNMVVTRSGHHFPRPEWAKWRDATVAVVKAQLPAGWQPLDVPCSVKLAYIAGDKRRRDQPAIIDALWHVLEKAGVVTDDCHLWVTESSRSYDKARPCCALEVRPCDG